MDYKYKLKYDEVLKLDEIEGIGETIAEQFTNVIHELYDYRDKFVFDTLKSLGYRPKNTKEYYKNLKKRLDKNNIKLSFKEERYKGIVMFKIIYVKDNETLTIASNAFRLTYNL